ncbi:MarR family transcriptional regulator [Pseudodesulfovibrio cashew]|uniref:MarR family transcriptional regulator n=1 Tax=Pseudodesulfovibrio cashew TaxID=2678688 RepID=A0A6I6JBR2_9BACT|nr:MarR family transcriptional regulator [Pseudodesulfovibrio cashew]QGY40215.1 MarR family transcriptional regulator [Pseudodesulfovibrio cashew]
MQYDIEQTASYLIYRVGRLLRIRVVQHFAEKGLDISPEQWELLLRIAEKGTPTLGDLADPLANDHPNVTRQVNGLVSLGLAVKTRHPEDRRSHVVSVSPQGQALINEHLPDLIEAKAEFFDGLDQNDVSSLITNLQTILGNLSR